MWGNQATYTVSRTVPSNAHSRVVRAVGVVVDRRTGLRCVGNSLGGATIGLGDSAGGVVVAQGDVSVVSSSQYHHYDWKPPKRSLTRYSADSCECSPETGSRI